MYRVLSMYFFSKTPVKNKPLTSLMYFSLKSSIISDLRLRSLMRRSSVFFVYLSASTMALKSLYRLPRSLVVEFMLFLTKRLVMEVVRWKVGWYSSEFVMGDLLKWKIV